MRISFTSIAVVLTMVSRVWAADPVDSAKALAVLNDKFSLRSAAGAAQLSFVAGEGGLTCAEVKTAACTGRVYLLGAHVAAWQPVGQEPVIFMSSKSPFAAGKAIRGGVPVCFPWFASKTESAVAGVGGTGGPGHGVVRTVEWAVEETRDLGEGKVSITLMTHSDAASKVYWPGDYEVRERVTFGPQLGIELLTKNTGAETMKYEEALHSYFAVKDVRHVTLLGLDGVDYLDKVDGRKKKTQAGPITFPSEADRIYLATKGPYTIVDDLLGRKISVEKMDSQTTVVWNPGAAKAVADLGPNEWMNYVAVETANIGDSAVNLKPGETKSMGIRVSVAK